MKKESALSLEALLAILSYQPETGLFVWLTSEGGVNIGAVAGYVNSNGYLVVGISGQKYRQHRLAWLSHYGVWPVGIIDHIDGDKTNNRISNLRDVSHSINAQNKREPTNLNTSGYLGVYWSQRRQGFMASLGIDNKQRRRGPYKSAERASAAYIDLKRKYHEGCTL